MLKFKNHLKPSDKMGDMKMCLEAWIYIQKYMHVQCTHIVQCNGHCAMHIVHACKTYPINSRYKSYSFVC